MADETDISQIPITTATKVESETTYEVNYEKQCMAMMNPYDSSPAVRRGLVEENAILLAEAEALVKARAEAEAKAIAEAEAKVIAEAKATAEAAVKAMEEAVANYKPHMRVIAHDENEKQQRKEDRKQIDRLKKLYGF
jgi:hypothetical protein